MAKIPVITARKDKSTIDYIVHFNKETSYDDARNYADIAESKYVKKYTDEDNSFVYRTDRLNINDAEKKLFRYSNVQGLSIVQSLAQKRYSELGKAIDNLNNLMKVKANEDKYNSMLETIIGNLQTIKDAEDDNNYHPNFRYRKAAKKKK